MLWADNWVACSRGGLGTLRWHCVVQTLFLVRKASTHDCWVLACIAAQLMRALPQPLLVPGVPTSAEAAAQQAAQLAAIACPSPHVPGTCSFLMAPLELDVRPEGGGHGQQRTGSGGDGGVGRLAGWLQALKQPGAGVERRLASLRLHLPEWGTDACAPVPPELVARGDGRCDVWLSAALVALCDAAAVAAGLQGGAALAGSREAPCGGGCEPVRLVALRARQLLAGVPTDATEDQALLAAGSLPGPMQEVMAYRMAKKDVLQRLAGLLSVPSCYSGRPLAQHSTSAQPLVACWL